MLQNEKSYLFLCNTLPFTPRAVEYWYKGSTIWTMKLFEADQEQVLCMLVNVYNVTYKIYTF